MMKSKIKHHKFLKVDENIYLEEYHKNHNKIYKSIVSKLKDIYISAYQGNEKFRYKSTKHIKSYIKWLINRCKDGFYLIYVRKKNSLVLIGFIAFEHNWMEKNIQDHGTIIHEFVIKKEYQSQGIGKKVLRYVLDHISKYNVKKIILSVGSENVRAINFYQKMGFKQVMKENDKDIVWHYMVKDL